MREIKKRHEEESDDPLVKLADDINKIWKSTKESASQREAWRKVEDGALTRGLRACSNLKGKLSCIQSIDSGQAMKLSCVFNELRMLLQTVNDAYMEFEEDIFEDEASATRYYTTVGVNVLELWSNCCELTTEFILLQRKYWEVTDEHGELSKSVADTCTTAVKLISTTVDIVKRTVADEQKESLLEISTVQATGISNLTTKLVQAVQEIKSSNVGPREAIFEMTLWMLYGLQHVSNDVIVPCMREDSKDQEWMQLYAVSLNHVMANLQLKPSEKEDSPEKGMEPDTKNSVPAQEEDKIVVKLDSEEIMKNFTEKSGTFTDELMESNTVVISLDDPLDPDTKIIYRPDIYKELARCSVGPCEMKDRVTWLNDIGLTDEEKLVSDMYIITNGPLTVSREVEVKFAATLTSQTNDERVLIKIKSSGTWQKVEVLKQEALAMNVHLSFKTSNVEAFVAYVEDLKESQEISAEGSTVTSPDNSQVFVQFPPGAVEATTNINLKFLSYDRCGLTSYLEQCPDSVVAIVGVSQVVEMSADTSVTLTKNISIQLSVDGDDTTDLRDTELVVVRYNGNQVQVLDKNQCRIRQVEYGIYRVESKEFWSIGLARIKKVFLNMKETVKKEFMLMFGKVQICNIVTLVDDALRDREKGLITFWIELLEKNNIKEQLEERKNAGLIEVQGSRSRDIAVKQSETLHAFVDGQIKLIGNSPTDKLALTYLVGTDNHFVVPMESKRDHEKLPYVTFTCKEEGSAYTLHTVAIPVRELTETLTVEMTSRQLTKQDENCSLRDAIRAKEEAAQNILAHNSLMCLARVLTASEGQKLSTNLGVSSEQVRKIHESYGGDAVTINFRILCAWRGNAMRSSMVDFLIMTLRTMGRSDYAAIITNVRNSSRCLTQQDFN